MGSLERKGEKKKERMKTIDLVSSFRYLYIFFSLNSSTIKIETKAGILRVMKREAPSKLSSR